MPYSISGEAVYQFARIIVRLYRLKNGKLIRVLAFLVWPIIVGFLIYGGLWSLTVLELVIYAILPILFLSFLPSRGRYLRQFEKHVKRRIHPFPGYGAFYVLAIIPFMWVVHPVVLEKGPAYFIPFFHIAFSASYGLVVLMFRPWILRVLFGCDRRTKILGALRHAR
ncbi:MULTISPECIES: hypothetical protein [Thalassospira]|uniref:hypothetical protein n=1 Tax=Thalassospira TaxID=168934 RepID=UPI002943D252|nr:hypothetical protein [Thalassospira lucentensis]WOI10794.1 hypothetical protein R1T41_20075 [Thalassospira lucentensis]